MSASPERKTLDETFFADPHTAYAALRQAGAVHQVAAPDGAPLHLVTSYDEVRAAAADPRLSVNKRHARTVGSHGNSMPPELDAHLLNSDPADHARLRRLVGGAFTPRRTEALRDLVQAAVDRLLDQIAPAGRADLMADLAFPLSMTVICDLLGIPVADRRDFSRWTNTLLTVSGTAEESRAAMREMHGFLVVIIDAKRREPTDDLLSALILARDNKDQLSEAELVAMAFLLLFGGYHNSASLICTTVLALLTHPQHCAALRAGQISMDQVTEETLRWNSPTMLSVRRFAVQDLKIGGTPVQAGDRVWLSWAAANRDRTHFPSPETFDPSRRGAAHLAFGHGPHYCPGASLARLENDIAVVSLLRRFPNLALLTSPNELTWVESLRSRRLQELPVTW